MKGMPPKLLSDDGKHIVIRPLAYSKEKDIERYAQAKQFPIIPCNLCGSQENLQRQAIKQMLQGWDKQFPGRLENMFRAMQNLTLSHMADTTKYNFTELEITGRPVEDGDTAFDPIDFPKMVEADTSEYVAAGQQIEVLEVK
jgi:tRNA 2-thiocytidine biosynthesis protein TtcA